MLGLLHVQGRPLVARVRVFDSLTALLFIRGGPFFCSYTVHIPYIHRKLSTVYNGYPPWKC